MTKPLMTAEEGKKRTRTWVRMGILMALLLTAGILLWQGEPKNQEREMPPTAETTASPQPQPTTGRSARELAYDEDMDALQQLIDDETVDEAVRTQAAEQLTKMVREHQTELGIETALTGAGFHPCLVLMQNDALTVTVDAEELTEAESITILSICMAHSEVTAENVRIMVGNERTSEQNASG